MPITRTDLIILAFLSENPSHGWEIDRKLSESGANYWAEYSRPHLYYALRKLEREGLVEMVKREEREARKQYCLTAKGRNLLQNAEIVSQLLHDRLYFDFDVLLGFSDRFRVRSVSLKKLIESRQEALQQELTGIQQVWEKAERSGDLPFGRLAVIKHRIKFLKSELEFLKWLGKNTPDDWESLNQPGGAP